MIYVLLVVAALVEAAFLLWFLWPPRRVQLPDRVSDEWLTQHTQQDR